MTWWRIPRAVWRAAAWNRRLFFAPYMYVGALVLGTLIGIGMDAVSPLPWWVMAAAVPVGLWVWAAAPAFAKENTWSQIRMALDPQKELERRRRKEEDEIRSMPLPLYGLARWTGLRSIGAHDLSGGEPVRMIELLHCNDPSDRSEPQVRIESALFDPHTHGDLPLYRLAGSLWAETEPTPAGLTGDALEAWHDERERDIERRQPPEPEERTIIVDGHAVRFACYVAGPFWGGTAQVGDVRVQIRAWHVPSDAVELVRVTDVEPYIEGSRRLLEGRER